METQTCIEGLKADAFVWKLFAIVRHGGGAMTESTSALNSEQSNKRREIPTILRFIIDPDHAECVSKDALYVATANPGRGRQGA